LCESATGRLGAVSRELLADNAGSRQSYWPCMTLWPISMLSVFDGQHGGACEPERREDAEQRAPPTSSRAALMIRRM
jgi:hypothetical protein